MAAPLVLASTSPRRRELLAAAGYKFEVFAAAVAESNDSQLSLRELTTANATRKALVAAEARPTGVVLAADTLVALSGEVIGKPSDLADARKILRRLSGKVHEVCTAVFLTARPRFLSFTDVSRVGIRELTDDAIDVYFAGIDPLDKAGAYAAQEGGIIASIEGSLSNVIGLPMERTVAALARFGIRPRQSYVSTATSAGAGGGTRAGSRRSTR